MYCAVGSRGARQPGALIVDDPDFAVRLTRAVYRKLSVQREAQESPKGRTELQNRSRDVGIKECG